MIKVQNILLAEDESIIALDVTNILTALGYNVIGVGRYKDEVVHKALNLNPDLILMDIMLDKNTSGIDAAQEICKHIDVPIIFLTALADSETLKKAQITDPFGYILKPYDARTLHSTIEMALFRHKMNFKIKDRTKELEKERIKTEELLNNIFPVEVANELKEKGVIEPREYKNATLLLTDFQNFTSIASNISPTQLVSELNDIFKNFDAIIDKYNVEKLKTIGDSYLVGAGFPKPDDNHALKLVLAALEMQEYLKQRNKISLQKWTMRAGIHTGSVITGVVGKIKFNYDVWGPTVKITKIMERQSSENEVNISESTFQIIKKHFYCTENGNIPLDDETKLKMYFVKEEKPHFDKVSLTTSIV